MSNTLTIVIKGDAAQFTRTIKQVESGIARAQGATRNFGHSTVSNTQAASAAIRLMEGDITNLVRAAERFVGQSQVLSGVLKTAFPAIGAIAIAGVLARGVEQVTKFIEQARKMPKAIEDGFRSLDLSGEMAVDELRKTNDALENQILKLEGKPQNNLAIALDDARIAADKLAKSLIEDQKQVGDLLKTNKISWMVSLITGQDTTGDMAKKVADWEQKRSDAGFDYQQAVRKYGPQSDQATKAKAALDKITADAEADMQAEIDYRKPGPYRAANLTGDQSANLSIAKGYLSDLQNRDDLDAQQRRNQADAARQQALEHAKELAEAQKRAQAQAEAAGRKYVEDAQERLTALKATQALSADDVVAYWQKLVTAAHKGSEKYKTALNELNKAVITANAEHQRQFGAMVTELVRQNGPVDLVGGSTTAERSNNENDILSASWDRLNKQDQQQHQQGIADQIKEFEQTVAAIRSSIEIASAQITSMVRVGQMSSLDAARQLQAIHRSSYDKFNAASANISNLQSDTSVSGLDSARIAKTINEMLATFGEEFDADWEDIRVHTVKGSLKQALDEMTQQFGDVAGKVPGILNGFVDGINGEVARLATGQRANFSAVFRQLGEQLATTSLQKSESVLMRALGFGQGQKQQHVIVDNWPAGSASIPGVGALANHATHGLLGWLNNSNWAGKLFGGKLFGSGGIFSHFAAGGDMLAGHPAVVGELGPELLLNPPSARVVPNHKLGQMGGGASYYIDASGANAADVEMRVQRALIAVHGSAVQTSVAAQRERAKRRPGGPRARF